MPKSVACKGIAATVLLLLETALAQIPPNFSPSASVQLQVAYGSPLMVIQPGQTVPFKDITPTAPTIGLTEPPESSGPFLITMIDPDAPTPQNPTEAQIAHWIQADLILEKPLSTEPEPFPYVLTTPEDPVAAFIPPAPPAGSPPHHYIQLLWIQPEDFSVPPAFAGFGGTNRTLFNVTAFAKAARLRGPIAANYWLTSMDYTKGGKPVVSQGSSSGSRSSQAPTSSSKSSQASTSSMTMTLSTANTTPTEATRSASPTTPTTSGTKPTGSSAPTSQNAAAASAWSTKTAFMDFMVAILFAALL